MEVYRYIRKESYNDSAELRAKKWIELNLRLFTLAVQEHILASQAKIRTDAADHGLALPNRLYDPNLRLPEEMPICTMWTRWAAKNPIPKGFCIVKGSVFVSNDAFQDSPSQSRRVDHLYLEALDESGVVLDHCAGQFYKRRAEDIPKGARLAVINEIGGSLVQSFTGSGGATQTFLIGERSATADRMGMQYDTKPRSER